VLLPVVWLAPSLAVPSGPLRAWLRELLSAAVPARQLEKRLSTRNNQSSSQGRG
jgi:hypothetical protein